MKFKRLRLSGFKSFVDPVELYLEEGLTGIVGPNGCGKSNLVEALRWVMGENSPKAMRGGGMDDVIFSGSSFRSGRNVAEVSLLLDNAERQAPAAFNDADDLEISRRIERECGSAYRINGREVRAKDIQILFADAATGSHSPSIVSQGRVGELINAKPRDRRSILESAAGISGLHARRHEAELRLKAAEDNLSRLADVMGQVESQLGSLKRQARHARRYQKLSGEIRSLEAVLLYLHWSAADEALAEAHQSLAEAEETVTRLTREAAAATSHQTEVSAKLPELRQAEAEAAAKLQRFATAIESLDAEAERIAERQEKLDMQRDQIAKDIEREKNLVTEAEQELANLADERNRLEAEQDEDSDKVAAAETAVETARQAAADADEKLQSLTTELARQRAERDAARNRREEAENRKVRLESDLAETDAALEAAQEKAPAESLESEAQARLEAAQQAVTAAEEALETAAAERAQTAARVEEKRDALDEAKAAFARLETEEDTLSRLLAGGDAEAGPAILESVGVTEGYEAALGAALGEDLEAPLGGDSPLKWETLPALESPPALPAAARPLSDVVEAPAALSRRLSQVGVVSEEAGPALQKELVPGQRLVSEKGDLWRWDGFTARHGAPTAAAARLEQKNRLTALLAEKEAAGEKLAAAETAFQEARDAAQAAAEQEEAARTRLSTAQKEAAESRDAVAEATTAKAEHDRELAGLTERRDRLAGELAEAVAALEKIGETDDGAADIAALEEKVEAARAESERRRQALSEAQSTLSNLSHERELRRQRLETIEREEENWSGRAANGREQIARLEERATEADEERRELTDKPADIARRKEAAESERAAAEEARQAAAAALAEQEDLVAKADRALKDIQTQLTEAREERIRIQAHLEQMEEKKRDYAERIREVLDCAPEQALDHADIDPEAPLPAKEDIAPKLDKLKTERERMGPVNLRAEQEAQELEEQLSDMQSERADLEEAIAKLRQGIANLNREGRERLTEAFNEVNNHFEDLFKRLFGGGRAYLTLTESDDPLEAGLEIMASPPGKRLQVMSLLSGGEQALTALSLIFAVFLTNPSPICVLDEVDAPLDDANVERFCDLLDDITRETGTRFLIVTHHPYTMSRVNHLFGVTMPERGISQLVSVDLDVAQELRAVS